MGLALECKSLSAPLLRAQIDAGEIELVSIAQGRAALYTARSPAKDTPNEDAVALIPWGEVGGVFVVADGLGGLPAGATASALAVETLSEVVSATPAAASLREAILDGIERANERVIALGTGAATTLAVVELQGRSVRSYHVGDSLILVSGQRGRIKHQTVAHSPVGYAVEAGLLDEAEAVHHEERNIVSNVLGAPSMRIDIGPAVELAPRDTLLLASDGLADNLYMHEIVEMVRMGPLERAMQRLRDACATRMATPIEGWPHHPDDLSLILYRPQP